MFQHVINSWITQGVYVAAKLGIADVLAAGPLGVPELARRVGAVPSTTYRLLRMLASVGIFRELEDGTFANTETSESLRDDVVGSQRPTVISMIEMGWSAWGDLAESVVTGQPAFPRVHGKNRYDALDENPALSAMFDRAMAGPALALTRAVTAAYDFSRYERIVDVGGGDGTLLSAILEAAPQARGVLFERPNVIEIARQRMHPSVAARCELVAGDFFANEVPSGDAIVLKAVLHNWSDSDASTLLARVARSVRRGGRLMVIEPLIAPGNDPDLHKLIDVHMLVMHGGRERSRAEYEGLLTAAGLKLVNVTLSSGPVIGILEAEHA